MAEQRTAATRALDMVEWVGNKLPHPFWLFCGLFIAVIGLSAGLNAAGVSVTKPETQLLTTTADGARVPGRVVEVNADGSGAQFNLSASSHSSRLKNIELQIYTETELVATLPLERSELGAIVVDAKIDGVDAGQTYRAHVVAPSAEVKARSLLSQAGLTWFVLHMVTNFAEFEPLGLVLVMLMGVAIAEGSGLIPTGMRFIALAVPRWLIIPVMFALGACGNIGSDAGIVVIPPLSAAIFQQMGKSPIAGLLVGYVGATAGFTANFLPAGTDVLAMALTNAATGGDPEVNVFCNWYFMSVSVFFLAAIGTWVTVKYTLPRLETGDQGPPPEIVPITDLQKRALGVAVVAVLAATAVWMLTIVPTWGLLRHPDAITNPDLVWRSPFFKGLVPILFTLFAVGGLAYGYAANTISKTDDIIEWMADSMRRMGPYIVLILVISQFIRAFQWANLDQLIAVGGADLLRALGMEQFPIPFFVAFICIVAVANLFMGSASAKWAIFAPIFVPMFMDLGLHPAFTQLLYRLGDSITNCVSPLYPFFPILLGWIAEVDPEKAKVGTVLSFLVPYASFLLVGWLIMLVGWYLLGLPVGPNSPLML